MLPQPDGTIVIGPWQSLKLVPFPQLSSIPTQLSSSEQPTFAASIPENDLNFPFTLIAVLQYVFLVSEYIFAKIAAIIKLHRPRLINLSDRDVMVILLPLIFVNMAIIIRRL